MVSSGVDRRETIEASRKTVRHRCADLSVRERCVDALEKRECSRVEGGCLVERTELLNDKMSVTDDVSRRVYPIRK